MKIHQVFKKLIDFVYPPLCLHCKTHIDVSGPLLCHICAELLSLLEVKGRCSRCFQQSGAIQTCRSCRTTKAAPGPVAAALSYFGPGRSFLKALDQHRHANLAIGLASLLVAQIHRLNWPTPTLIVPMPSHWLTRLIYGPSTAMLLARALGGLLSCETDDLLRRGAADLKEEIWLRRGAKAADKTILVIDTQLHPNGTLLKAMEAAMEACPAQIYGLALCKEDDG